VRHQDHEHCASITCMIRHYVARRAQVSEAHPHNAENSALSNTHSYVLTCMLTHVLRLGRNSPECVAWRCPCAQGRSQIADSARVGR
jgi:hypothetical protein